MSTKTSLYYMDLDTNPGRTVGGEHRDVHVFRDMIDGVIYLSITDGYAYTRVALPEGQWSVLRACLKVEDE